VSFWFIDVLDVFLLLWQGHFSQQFGVLVAVKAEVAGAAKTLRKTKTFNVKFLKLLSRPETTLSI